MIFRFAIDRWGGWAAALAAGAWVLQPNLFGHGHYAGYDAVLTSLWVLSIVVFAQVVAPQAASPPARSRWCWTLTFGLVLGCAAATKLTGWFLPLPFLAWAVLYRSRQGFETLFLGLFIAMLVLWALVPPWWKEPLAGVVRFLESNLSRGETIPIKVLFLGTVYDTPKESLPWYNTLVWTLFVTPVGFLMMAGVGFWAALRNWRNESIGLLIAGHWAFLMILRALPHTPGHDGVRLFLPAFGVLALLAGLGARSCARPLGPVGQGGHHRSLARGSHHHCCDDARAALLLHPARGWTAWSDGPRDGGDVLLGRTQPAARRWLAENTLPGRTYAFSGFPHSWLYLRRTGELPRHLAPIDPGRPQWLVVQNRPGAFSRDDRALVARRPACVQSHQARRPL